jgi:small basic protein
MSFFLNILLQLGLMIGQVANQVSTLVPEKWRPLVLAGLAALQAVVGLIAHRHNPDGTKAEEPWSR